MVKDEKVNTLDKDSPVDMIEVNHNHRAIMYQSLFMIKIILVSNKLD